MDIRTVADNDTKFEVLVQGKYYRVTNITKLTRVKQLDEELQFQFVNLLPEEGLNVEEKCKDGKHYIVVNTLYYNKDKKRVELKDVGCRTIDTLDRIEYDRLEEYHNCLSFAKQALIDMHEKKNNR